MAKLMDQKFKKLDILSKNIFLQNKVEHANSIIVMMKVSKQKLELF
jgi:hypothetical protein